MGWNTDYLFNPDEVDIETANFIRKGMPADKALAKARIIVQERSQSSGLREAKCPNCITGYYDNHIDICGVCGHERRR